MIIFSSYIGALFISKTRTAKDRYLRKIVLGCTILVILLPFFMVKAQVFVTVISFVFKRNSRYVIIPLGISFFTMQMIAYLVDVYYGKITAQKNFFKYSLFISFFPQIIQGPIPRYEQLEPQLVTGHKFNEENFTRGFHLIIWGFFLKLMIADKAAVVVNTIFDNSDLYKGMYVLVGGVLYSIQLYTDFLSCVTLAKGVAMLFGIRLMDNFKHPYFSVSIKEFWGKWHLSLSSWLKDYIYIPLGGNRKGVFRKYANVVITFSVSGIWHGWGLKYVIWGLMHAVYQIVGEWTYNIREKIYTVLGFEKESPEKRFLKRIITFILVMFAWIIFRAETLKDGISMLMSVFRVYNPWILFDDSIFLLGLSWKEWIVLAISLLIFIKVSKKQEQHSISQWLVSRPLIIRWLIYIFTIIVIFVYGTYGFGFNAQEFIYGGF
ncbi:MAG: MBOAT family protein [Eubacterium sp.]|nr:MBOAT family protein [Eubacterium sp.]